MKTIQDPAALISELHADHVRPSTLGFVPTMGYLHDGHCSLIREARKSCSKVVVSIFVNPLQFNDSTDFEQYPSDFDRDVRILKDEGVDILFAPAKEALYGPAHQTRVNVPELARPLEGKFRPGHFEGVATIVSMLFNIVRPQIAIFGEKDFQQLRIVEQLVSDLHLPIRILRGKIIREPDGLAMSSRNVRLAPSARSRALMLSRALFTAREVVSSGTTDTAVIKNACAKILEQAPDVRVEYFEIAAEADLLPVAQIGEKGPSRALIAAYVDGVRLIDNIAL